MKQHVIRDRWRISADASLQAVVEDRECPLLLRRVLTGALSWHMRNETSVGRALKSSRVVPQWLAALLALGATVSIVREDGEEEIPLEAVVQRRSKGEINELGVLTEGKRWGKALVARTPADEAIVMAVAGVEMGENNTVRSARVALTGVWQETVRLAESPARLVGGPLDEAGIRDVAMAVEQEVAPRGDFLGSEEYRRAMAGVLTRRALEACLRGEAE